MAVTPDLGAKAFLKLSGSATDDTAVTTIGEVNSVGFNLSAENIDSTAIGQAENAVFGAVIAGKRGASVTFSMSHDGVNDTDHQTLIDNLHAGSSNTFRLYLPQSSTGTAVTESTTYAHFDGIVEAFDISDDPGSKHTADLTISSTGAITVVD
jgi:hypothetical protein